jgi:hypothetical protein
MALAKKMLNATCRGSVENPKLDPTRNQIADNPLKTTVAQMADTRYPTPAQYDAIEHREEYLRPCIQASEQYFSMYAPAALPIYQQTEQDGKARLARLLSGKMTFGQYNTERAHAASSAWTAMQQAEQGRVAQAQQLYLQQQAVTQQAVQNDMNTMRALTPHTATCTRFGNTVNCVGQ